MGLYLWVWGVGGWIAANAELSSLARKIEQGKARVEEESRLLELEQAASKRWQDESHRRAEVTVFP